MFQRSLYLLVYLHLFSAKHFAFYDVSVEDLPLVADFSDIFFAGSIADAREASKFGLKSLLSVSSAFFNSSSRALREDAQQQWENVEKTTRSLVDKGDILGFNIGDELAWNCFSTNSIHEATEMIRKSFPRGSAILWTNEAGFIGDWRAMKDSCGQSRTEYRIPEGLDWFSVDIYHMDGKVDDWVDLYPKTYYESVIFPNLTESQKAILVPGSFGSDVNHYPNGTYVCDRQCYDKMCSQDAHGFVDWAMHDERVAGIFPWNWGGCPSCNGSRWTPPHTCCMDEIGTKDMPLTRKTWKSLGLKMLTI